MVFGIKEQINLPVIYAGLGEKVEDLQLNRESFIEGIFAEDNLES